MIMPPSLSLGGLPGFGEEGGCVGRGGGGVIFVSVSLSSRVVGFFLFVCLLLFFCWVCGGPHCL